MKLYQYFLLCLVALCLAMTQAQGGSPRVRDTSITVTTMTATVIPANPRRVWITATNESLLYDIRTATWSITQSALSSASRGYPLLKNYGASTDDYHVCTSSWFLIIDSQTAPGNATPISATVTYREKD